MHERLQLGDLTVDLDSGEVHRPDGTVHRMAPQPASLLALLVEHAGEVVDREQIREHLWPDVELDFEAGLHYCVRQVRAALGDTASEAFYVETLARRGYRLKVWPEPLKPATARSWVALLAVLLLAVFGLALSRVHSAIPRLAILPFEPPASWADATRTESVPELLLLEMGQSPESLVVLGPTSTAGHGADGTDLAGLVADLRVQWAINGRYIETEETDADDGRALLVELIRGQDGAHVWVEAFPLEADPAAVAESVAAGVSSRLGH